MLTPNVVDDAKLKILPILFTILLQYPLRLPHTAGTSMPARKDGSTVEVMIGHIHQLEPRSPLEFLLHQVS